MCIDQDTWSMNVSIDGKHYCRITLPPNLTEEQAARRAGVIANALAEEGVKFSLTRWTMRGRSIDIP